MSMQTPPAPRTRPLQPSLTDAPPSADPEINVTMSQKKKSSKPSTDEKLRAFQRDIRVLGAERTRSLTTETDAFRADPHATIKDAITDMKSEVESLKEFVYESLNSTTAALRDTNRSLARVEDNFAQLRTDLAELRVQSGRMRTECDELLGAVERLETVLNKKKSVKKGSKQAGAQAVPQVVAQATEDEQGKVASKKADDSGEK